MLKAAIVKHLEKNTELIEISAATLLKQRGVQDIFTENHSKVSNNWSLKPFNFIQLLIFV